MEKAANTARNCGAKWTDDEDAIVLAWIDRPIMETAIELGRTYMAVCGSRRNLRRQNMPE